MGVIVRLLLVEDSNLDAEVVVETLEQFKLLRFKLERATTLREAKEWLKKSSFDVIILDLGLPDSTGVDTVANIKAVCGEQPILVLTGTVGEEAKHKALRAGATTFVLKGATDQTLAVSIMSALVDAQMRKRARLDSVG